jgi:hypothetical protein
MTCQQCRFYFQAKSECRRYAPQPAQAEGGTWPTVASDDWCGEFEPKVVGSTQAA